MNDEMCNHPARVGDWQASASAQAQTSLESEGIPASKQGAIDAGGVAAASGCVAAGAGLAAPLCAAAGRWVMGNVVLPVAQAVYNRGKELFFGAQETDEQIAYKNRVAAAHNEAAAALAAKLAPLLKNPATVEKLIRWYLIDSLDSKTGLQSRYPGATQTAASWAQYEAALRAFVAPGGLRDQGLSARVAQALKQQKQETGFDPMAQTFNPLQVFNPAVLLAVPPQYFALVYTSAGQLIPGVIPAMAGPFATPQAAAAAAQQMGQAAAAQGLAVLAQTASYIPPQGWGLLATVVQSLPVPR